MATNIPALRKAIKAVGTQAEMAEALTRQSGIKISQKGVAKWLMVGRCPLSWLVHIEAVSGVRCHEIDPDHYHPPKRAAA